MTDNADLFPVWLTWLSAVVVVVWILLWGSGGDGGET